MYYYMYEVLYLCSFYDNSSPCVGVARLLKLVNIQKSYFTSSLKLILLTLSFLALKMLKILKDT